MAHSRQPFDITAIRAQFPALRGEGDLPTFFDGPAGTQVPDRVVERMVEALTVYNANSHGHFSSSARADAVIEASRAAVGDLFNAPKPHEIIFGPNMTSLTFSLTRTLASRLQPGDELVLTGMQHDGNVTPWLRLAEERDLVVRRLEFDPTTYELDLSGLPALLNARTKLVAINYASNVLGTINDVAAICALAKQVGALSYVDAVQYAPHGPVDVQALDCDFLVASVYKIYGPHLGVLYGRPEVLAELSPHKLRAADDAVPDRFETGCKSLEAIAGTLGAVEYLTWVGETYGIASPAVSAQHRARTATCYEAFAAMSAYELPLMTRLIEGLQQIDGVVVHGLTDPATYARRVPTVSISKDGLDNAALAQALSDHGIYVWDGHVYALDVIERLGLQDRGGIVRFGLTHYNTIDEVERTVGLVDQLVR